MNYKASLSACFFLAVVSGMLALFKIYYSDPDIKNYAKPYTSSKKA